ncbi:MAG: NADH-quinone oxidoreductase subunit L [Acidimicrobiia bacterium]|nr:NADH-quinone oxidoreductase subunit L [Acidimicrobiia bacterium]
MVLTLLPHLLAAFEEGEHAVEVLTDPSGFAGVLADFAWLIPVVPLLAAFAIVLFGKRLPLKGWELAEGAIGFVAVYAVALLIVNWGTPMAVEHHIEISRIANLPGLGDLVIEWGWVVDGLSIMMFTVVGVVGLFVFTYAKGYMEGDVRFTFFFASFSLFAGGMLVLVIAPNLIQLIVGWELVGIASYLLIGHWWEDHANNAAATKAFITNKIADIGLFIGVIILGTTVGSFRITDVLDAVARHDSALASVAFWAGLTLFIGAMGKSAQMPFHVWLPDAMAGPTPVSSLMHAATMVTAGVYLVGRMFPLYQTDGMADDVKVIIILVGGATLLLTGLIALVQDDIKKVLAYSTLSQLGYMMAAMGAGAYTAGLFHLFTHAFFKGLLFLAAGSVIHGVHSNNMSDMGGLRKFMPGTYKTFLIGSIALAGIFPLAGFWSKDEILASLSHDAGHGGGAAATAVLVLAIAGAFITAFYMTRAVYLTFFGEYKGDGHPHESPRVMVYPLWGLAGLAMVAGFVNIPGVYTAFTGWLASRIHVMGDQHAESLNWTLALIGTAVALAGIAAGTRLFRKDAATQQERDRFRIPVLYPLLEHKYYFDDLYMKGIVGPTKGPIARFVVWTNQVIIDGVVHAFAAVARIASRFVYGWADQRGIDLAINAAAAGAGQAGEVVRKAQTGKVQQYAGALFAGAVLLVVGFLIFS